MKTKMSQNPSWEPCWWPLGASWAPLGPILKKMIKKERFALPFLKLAYLTKIDAKFGKIDVEKGIVLRYVFFERLSSILHRF